MSVKNILKSAKIKWIKGSKYINQLYNIQKSIFFNSLMTSMKNSNFRCGVAWIFSLLIKMYILKISILTKSIVRSALFHGELQMDSSANDNVRHRPYFVALTSRRCADILKMRGFAQKELLPFGLKFLKHSPHTCALHISHPKQGQLVSSAHNCSEREKKKTKNRQGSVSNKNTPWKLPSHEK